MNLHKPFGEGTVTLTECISVWIQRNLLVAKAKEDGGDELTTVVAESPATAVTVITNVRPGARSLKCAVLTVVVEMLR